MSLPQQKATAENMDITSLVQDLAKHTKSSARALQSASNDVVDNILLELSKELMLNKEIILQANALDIDAANAKGLSDAMIDRLRLDTQRIQAIADSVIIVKNLDNPTQKVLWETTRPNGLKIQRISVPIGTLGMIYESRPNVTIDAAALCLKSRNTVILRGGSESLHSSKALHAVIEQTLEKNGLPKSCVSMIPVSDREAVGVMLNSPEYIDVMVPRGGKGLIERVMNNAKMPVFGHLEGLCHIYIDKSVDADIAKTIPLNAKMRRTGVCGAMETLLLDRMMDQGLARDILANLQNQGCEIVGDAQCQNLLSGIQQAQEKDWTTEYLEAKLSCRFVDGVEQAIEHINHYGSHHTDCILAEDPVTVTTFMNAVDSGIVMHNTSTQFADGGEFGMGAEIGIATGKMHARGPVGLEQLCTYKYLVHGDGQERP